MCSDVCGHVWRRVSAGRDVESLLAQDDSGWTQGARRRGRSAEEIRCSSFGYQPLWTCFATCCTDGLVHSHTNVAEITFFVEVFLMLNCFLVCTGTGDGFFQRLACSVVQPLLEAIYECRQRPKCDWPASVYNLIGQCLMNPFSHWLLLIIIDSEVKF